MSVAAILLAAGQSRRMGAFKPLLPFGSSTVAECCVSYLLAGGAARIVVVIGHRQDEVRARLTHLPVHFAVNPASESEMGDSIARGVEQLPAETEAVLIALTDQPAIPSSVPEALIKSWRRRDGARLFVPEHGGRGGHPVLIDISLRRELLNLDPHRGLRALFGEHRTETRRVAVGSPYIARDMDTWDDYRALYEEVFGTTPPVEGPA
jgi:molybdenum cofactor cytidylyltransferase